MTDSCAHSRSPQVDTVVELLRRQIPELAELPVRASGQEGSSNWMFRLGDELAVRLPRSQDDVGALRSEVTWLPRIRPGITVPTPRVMFSGQPSPTFPRPWAVVSWIPGERPPHLTSGQQRTLAADLGRFSRELHGFSTLGVPAGPTHWGYRCGEPVTDETDAWVQVAAHGLEDIFDPDAVREAWRRIRHVPPATSPPCWVHTDLSAENLLVHADGHLAGVVDFGGLGVGDASVDLLYGWSLFDAPARATFREAAGADEATWLRARAFAFAGPGLLTLLDYRDAMPERTVRLTRMIRAIATDVGIELGSP